MKTIISSVLFSIALISCIPNAEKANVSCDTIKIDSAKVDSVKVVPADTTLKAVIDSIKKK